MRRKSQFFPSSDYKNKESAILSEFQNLSDSLSDQPLDYVHSSLLVYHLQQVSLILFDAGVCGVRTTSLLNEESRKILRSL